MSLENVHIWEDGKGYVPISVEEACERYSHTVSYHSEIFICKLCGNYVTLTESKSGKKERHFRHSPLDYDQKINADQLCEDRSKFTAQIYQDASPLALHVMPMRMMVNPNGFSLEIGFYCPTSVSDLKDGSISIYNPFSAFSRHFYVDRIAPGETTYLSVGSTILDEYLLSYVNIPHQLAQFWPNKVEGFFDHGGVFYASSGKRIYRGAKVTLNHDFLFLFSHKHLNWFLANTSGNKVIRKEIYEFKTAKESWLVYKVRLAHINKNSTDLFLKYGIELAEQAPDCYQFWPPKIYSSNQIINCARELYFYLNGPADKVQLYPKHTKHHGSDSLLSVPTEHGTIFRVIPNQKAQLLILGEHGAVGFIYLNQDSSSLPNNAPQLSITSSLIGALEQDRFNNVDDLGDLTIISEVDGKLKIYEQDKLINILRLKSGPEHKLILSKGELSLGRRYDFYHGCSLVRSLELLAPSIHPKPKNDQVNKDLVSSLQTPQSSLSNEFDLALRQRLQLCLLASLNNKTQTNQSCTKAPIIMLKELKNSLSSLYEAYGAIKETSKEFVSHEHRYTAPKLVSLPDNKVTATVTSIKTTASIAASSDSEVEITNKSPDYTFSSKPNHNCTPKLTQETLAIPQAIEEEFIKKLHAICQPLDVGSFNNNEQTIRKLALLAKKRYAYSRTEPFNWRLVNFALDKLYGYPLTLQWLKLHAKQGTLNQKVMRELMAYVKTE